MNYFQRRSGAGALAAILALAGCHQNETTTTTNAVRIAARPGPAPKGGAPKTTPKSASQATPKTAPKSGASSAIKTPARPALKPGTPQRTAPPIKPGQAGPRPTLRPAPPLTPQQNKQIATNQQLGMKLLMALVMNPQYRDAQLSVGTSGNIVTLNGYAKNEAQKKQIESAARAQAPGHKIVNNITIGAPPRRAPFNMKPHGLKLPPGSAAPPLPAPAKKP